ncbi:MAG: VanZ family protein [Burkholderiales bacterium]
MPEVSARLRFIWLWRVIGFAMIATVLTLSLIPIEADLGKNSDKLGHFLAYGSLMFWFGMLYIDLPARLRIAIGFCAMGIGIEFLQGMTSYRSFEMADMLANSVGVAIGWGIACTPLKSSLATFEKLLLLNGAR